MAIYKLTDSEREVILDCLDHGLASVSNIKLDANDIKWRAKVYKIRAKLK